MALVTASPNNTELTSLGKKFTMRLLVKNDCLVAKNLLLKKERKPKANVGLAAYGVKK
jgi:hypothetical protein